LEYLKMADKRTNIATAIAKNGNAQLTNVGFAIVKKNNAFSVIASFVDAANDVVSMADDNGKLKQYKAVDDFVSAAVRLNMLAPTCDFSFSGLTELAPVPFTGDIIAKNQKLLVSMTAKKVTADEKVTKLTLEVSLMQADSTVPASLIAEKQAQLAAVTDYGVWLQSEVDRITTALGGGGSITPSGSV
jgi:hypothetical protein